MKLHGVDEAALVENRDVERSVDRLDAAADRPIVAAVRGPSVRGQLLRVRPPRGNQAGDCEHRREQHRRDVRMLPHVRTSLGPPRYQRTTRARRSLEDPRSAGEDRVPRRRCTRESAVSAAAVESTAVEPAAVESTAVESTAVEPSAVEPVAVESTVE